MPVVGFSGRIFRYFGPKNGWGGLKSSRVFKVEQGRDGVDGRGLEGKGSWLV